MGMEFVFFPPKEVCDEYKNTSETFMVTPAGRKTGHPESVPRRSCGMRPGRHAAGHSGDADSGIHAIPHPADLQGDSQGTYSWTLDATSSEPSGPAPNFVYVSVIPDRFQGQPGDIYNHDPAEANALFNMQVGESKSLHPDLNTASSFTYTRLPDTTLSDQSAQAYENSQPWEFPVGTKEIRYYLQGNGCTYLVGGYVDTLGSGQPGAINAELFDQIISTFRLSL
jgi:hypothetical protein